VILAWKDTKRIHGEDAPRKDVIPAWKKTKRDHGEDAAVSGVSDLGAPSNEVLAKRAARFAVASGSV
jgi:hypothetical protein